jgi:hypothetical protein
MKPEQVAHAIDTPSLQPLRGSAADGPRSPEMLAAFRPDLLGPGNPVLAYPGARLNGPLRGPSNR